MSSKEAPVPKFFINIAGREFEVSEAEFLKHQPKCYEEQFGMFNQCIMMWPTTTFLEANGWPFDPDDKEND